MAEEGSTAFLAGCERWAGVGLGRARVMSGIIQISTQEVFDIVRRSACTPLHRSAKSLRICNKNCEPELK
jgi:hypothetical protein